MNIGVLKETKAGETRVALLPEHVAKLTAAGHVVRVELGAGEVAGSTDSQYLGAGALVASSAASIWARAELILKFKEIEPAEFDYLRHGLAIHANLHTAANPTLTDALLGSGVTAFSAEETHTPFSSNSVLAGEIGALNGLAYSQATRGGTGRLPLRHAGELPLLAVVLGLGAASMGAVKVLSALGCRIVVLNRSEEDRWAADFMINGAADVTFADIGRLPYYFDKLDLLINCVTWDKRRKDHLVTAGQLGQFQKGAVIVDVSCDEAGAIETSRPTSWAHPVFVTRGVTHFCVPNLPAAAPRVASKAYGDLIINHVLGIAELGPIEAAAADDGLARGLSCHDGVLTHAETAHVQSRLYTPAHQIIRGLR